MKSHLSSSEAFWLRIRLGINAKPLPATKADLGLLSDFRDVGKSSEYRRGYTCGFFTSRKSNINPTSTFSLRVGFALLHLDSPPQRALPGRHKISPLNLVRRRTHVLAFGLNSVRGPAPRALCFVANEGRGRTGAAGLGHFGQQLDVHRKGFPWPRRSPCFDARLVKNGGEAWVRLNGDTVLRFERKLITTNASWFVRRRFLKKMKVMRKLLPSKALAPKLPIHLADSGYVVGHTMEYVENLRSFKDDARNWTASQATDVLLELHAFITECHRRKVLMGEVNPSNVGFGPAGFVAIDTLAYDIPGYPCETLCDKTVDPRLLAQRLSLRDSDRRAWLRRKNYSKDSDWFGFACVELDVLVGRMPWDGTHYEALKKPELDRLRVRALSGVSIFDRNVNVKGSGLRRPLEPLSEPLYNHLYEVFKGGRRGIFPEELLRGTRWTRCSACQVEVSAQICPCRGASACF